MIFCALKGWDHLLLWCCHPRYTPCPPGLGQPHSTPVTVSHGLCIALALPISWVLHCDWGFANTSGLRTRPQGLRPATWCQVWALLHESFSPGVPTATEVTPSPVATWPLLCDTLILPHSAKSRLFSMTPSCLQSHHMWETPTHCQVWLRCIHLEMQPWPLLDNSFYVLTPGKQFPEDFIATMLVS